jgi:pimeloyl-ACP methyl ester carboxylesterase
MQKYGVRMSTLSEGMKNQPHLRKHRIFYRFLRGLKLFGIVVITILILGFVYQMIATEVDRHNFPPPGILVDVDGHKMHILCIGNGSPTVILEAGGFSFSSEWNWVQQQLASSNRVCAYDRAGNGWSEPGPAPRTAQQIVGELHTLLTKANIPGPYVLVGHSFGGILNRVYAAQYPGEVLGIVLVDTAYNVLQFTSVADYEQWKRDNDLLNAPLWALIRVGAARFINANAFQGYGYNTESVAELVAFRSTNQSFDTYYSEGIAVAWQNQQSFANAHLGNLPLMVLWATTLPRKLTPAEEERLASLQKEVAGFSSNSETRYIQGSDHGSIIGTEQYAQQVTQGILDVIAAAQKAEGLAKP